MIIKYVCSFFFWSLSCAILVYKLYISIRTILDCWAVLIFEVFYGGIFQKINFNSWSFFRCFFWSVNFAGWALLSQHIRILLLLAIFPDLEMAQFWSVNYICQVYKLKLILDMSKILDNIYIDRFLLVAFVKYTLLQIIVFGTVFFDTFWKLWKLVF